MDDSLRRAAYDRGVHVRVLGSVWEHTMHDELNFLASLAAVGRVGPRNGTIEAVSGFIIIICMVVCSFDIHVHTCVYSTCTFMLVCQCVGLFFCI